MVSEFQFYFHSVFLRGLRGLLTFVANGATDGGRGLSTHARMRRKEYESEVGGPV